MNEDSEDIYEGTYVDDFEMVQRELEKIRKDEKT